MAVVLVVFFFQDVVMTIKRYMYLTNHVFNGAYLKRL